MPIDAECPDCGAEQRFPDEDAARRVRCRDCGKQFRLPEADVEEAGPPDAPDRQGAKLPWYYEYLRVCATAALAAGVLTLLGGAALFMAVVVRSDGSSGSTALAFGVLSGLVALLLASMFTSAMMYLAIDVGKSLRAIRRNTEGRDR